MTHHALPRAARIGGTVAIVALGLFVLFAILALVWVGARSVIAADNLREARALAPEVVAQIGDPAAATDTIAEISHHTAVAHAMTSDPIWRIVEGAPWIGPQLTAVSTLAASADAIAGDGLAPLVEVAGSVTPESLRPVDGRIDLTPFLAVQDAAAAAAVEIGDAADAARDIDSAALLGPLREVVTEAQTVLGEVGDGAEALSRAALLLPRMLGADGPRNYLVLFQNNAEWRSLGGIAGSAALVHTDGGAMDMPSQDYAAAIGPAPGGIAALDPEVEAIYGIRPAVWFHNVTQVPDFAVSGELARAFWARTHGVEVDGVLSIDPVALSYLLAATGPVTLPDGTVLDADNATAVLLNDVYVRFPDPAEQNAFFDSATGAVFDALVSGRASPGALLEAFARAGDERRLFLWSAHEADQALLADTTLAGSIHTSDSTLFGVFLNDGTGSKMDYYQTAESTIQWTSCRRGPASTATGSATLTTVIRNDAPAGLPDYITGAGSYGVTPGNARTLVYVSLPVGAELMDAALSTGGAFGGGFHERRQVISYEIELAQGEEATAQISVRFDRPTDADLAIWQTPTVNATVTAGVASCL